MKNKLIPLGILILVFSIYGCSKKEQLQNETSLEIKNISTNNNDVIINLKVETI